MPKKESWCDCRQCSSWAPCRAEEAGRWFHVHWRRRGERHLVVWERLVWVWLDERGRMAFVRVLLERIWGDVRGWIPRRVRLVVRKSRRYGSIWIWWPRIHFGSFGRSRRGVEVPASRSWSRRARVQRYCCCCRREPHSWAPREESSSQHLVAVTLERCRCPASY